MDDVTFIFALIIETTAGCFIIDGVDDVEVKRQAGEIVEEEDEDEDYEDEDNDEIFTGVVII